MESCRTYDGEAGAKVEDDIMVNGSNEFEQHKLSLLRFSVEIQDPTSKGVDDIMLKRFLRARDLDVEKASNLLIQYLKWRREFVPKGFVSESEITYELARKQFFIQGTDKGGHPIGVVLTSKHLPNKAKGGLDEFKRCVVYFLDKLCSRTQNGQGKFVVIADLQGWGYSNFDLRGYLGAISILQDCYPERLHKLILPNAPYIFMAVWKMIYPFIDNNTRKKVSFIENKKLTSTLLQVIDQSQIPDIYGGKQSLLLPLHFFQASPDPRKYLYIISLTDGHISYTLCRSFNKNFH